MKITTAFFLSAGLLILLFSRDSWGNIVVPNFVYRADFRDPRFIFHTGFGHIGQNTNILEHVQGVTCSYGPNPSTAFVATTSEEAFAVKWGGDQIWIDNEKGPYVFIYKIRATPDFYSAYDSLLNTYRRTRKKKYQSAADKYQYQKEWLAFNGIRTELIVSAKVMMRGEPGKLTLVRTELNQRYRDGSSSGNPQPFIDTSPSASDRLSLLASRLPLLGSCFGSCPSRSRSEKLYPIGGSTRAVCPSRQTAFEASSTAEKATVWDPLTKEARERIVPWKEETLVRGHVVEKPGSCTVFPGTSGAGHPLQIMCTKNKFYDSFVVLLKAGIGDKTMINTRFDDGVTGKLWKKGTLNIPLASGSGTLRDQRVSIVKVFHKISFDANTWWSFIRVYPMFPDYRVVKN